MRLGIRYPFTFVYVITVDIRNPLRYLLITGEGRMDGQTAMGKAPVGVAALAKKYCKPVLAFAGAVERDARKCNEHGIDAFFPILRGVVTLEEAMKNENAKRNLADTAEQVYRTFTIL